MRTLGERLWGTTPGKALVGVRVVGIGRPRPGLVRALARNAILIWPVLLGIILRSYNPGLMPNDLVSFWVVVGWLVLLAALGWLADDIGVAPHDWLAGTRVIYDPSRRRQQYRAPDLAPPLAPTAGDSHIGPYRILERRASDTAGETYLAFDDTLERRLWVRVYKTQLPPAPAAERDLHRRSRLRWINGRRTAHENWDAWEHVPGETPQSAGRKKLPWRDVRGWLHSLAYELGRSARDRTEGSVGSADLWLAEDGRAIVADFPFEDPAHGSVPIGRRRGSDQRRGAAAAGAGRCRRTRGGRARSSCRATAPGRRPPAILGTAPSQRATRASRARTPCCRCSAAKCRGSR